MTKQGALTNALYLSVAATEVALESAGMTPREAHSDRLGTTLAHGYRRSKAKDGLEETSAQATVTSHTAEEAAQAMVEARGAVVVEEESRVPWLAGRGTFLRCRMQRLPQLVARATSALAGCSLAYYTATMRGLSAINVIVARRVAAIVFVSVSLALRRRRAMEYQRERWASGRPAK